jgi:hypothetical protein
MILIQILILSIVILLQIIPILLRKKILLTAFHLTPIVAITIITQVEKLPDIIDQILRVTAVTKQKNPIIM